MRKDQAESRKVVAHPRASPEARAFVEYLTKAVPALSGVLKAPLGKSRRTRLPRIRVKGWGHVEMMIHLAEENPAYAPYKTPTGELRKMQADLLSLELVVSALRAMETLTSDSIRALRSELWKAALTIYGIAGSQRKDPNAATFAANMREAMKHGPRLQKSVMTDVPPVPTGKAAIKKAALAAAKKQAKLPEPPPTER